MKMGADLATCIALVKADGKYYYDEQGNQGHARRMRRLSALDRSMTWLTR